MTMATDSAATESATPPDGYRCDSGIIPSPDHRAARVTGVDGRGEAFSCHRIRPRHRLHPSRRPRRRVGCRETIRGLPESIAETSSWTSIHPMPRPYSLCTSMKSRHSSVVPAAEEGRRRRAASVLVRFTKLPHASSPRTTLWMEMPPFWRALQKRNSTSEVLHPNGCVCRESFAVRNWHAAARGDAERPHRASQSSETPGGFTLDERLEAHTDKRCFLGLPGVFSRLREQRIVNIQCGPHAYNHACMICISQALAG